MRTAQRELYIKYLILDYSLFVVRRKLADNQSNFIQDDMCGSIHAFNHVEMFNANNHTLNNVIIRTVQTNECYSNDKVLSSIESVTIRMVFRSGAHHN